MATFKFVHEEPLYYSDLGKVFAPNDSHEFDEAPDHHWIELQEDGSPVPPRHGRSFVRP